MPDSPYPKPESPQELAWRLANPLLADLSTARLRELQAEFRAHSAAAARAAADYRTLMDWLQANSSPLPGF